jgi:RNA polymerase sigma-70 factor (ECF subfamily)
MERNHGSRLRRYLSARMRNAAADVPDLMQEVFLRLLRLEDHEAIRNPQAYLFTIARHVLHQHALKLAETPRTVEIHDVVAELSALPDADPAAHAELEERFQRLGRALAADCPRAYATLILHRCDGVPLKEISEIFGVSYTMTKRYLARALAFSQQYLDDAEQGRP